MAKFLWMVCILYILSACSLFEAGPKTGVSPEALFEVVLAQPVPDTVTELQGVAEIWQGYGFYLRFNASSATRDLLFEEFASIPCDDIIAEFTLPDPDYDLFTPSWNPEGLTNPQCLEQSGIQNEQTHAGTNFVMFDPVSGVIYFVGVGA